jgi:hypothetical protein
MTPFSRLPTDLLAAADGLAAAEWAGFGARPSVRRFRRFGRWLLAEQSLPDWSRHPELRRSIFGAMPAAGIAPLLWLAPRHDLASDAAAIMLKSNVRAFYPQWLATVKLAGAGPKAQQRLRAEALTRGKLRSTPAMMVPKLLFDGSATGECFIVDEMVVGHPLRRGASPPASLARDLVDFQRANGLTVENWRGRIDIRRTIGDIALRLPRDDGSGQRQTLRRISRLFEDDGQDLLVTAGLCHGDLTVTNLIAVEGGFAIVDWEYAEPAPCFVDAVRLATQLNGFAGAYMAQYDAQIEPPPKAVLPAHRQFLLACLVVCGQRIARRAQFEDDRKRAAYERKLAKKLVIFLGFAATLLTDRENGR